MLTASSNHSRITQATFDKLTMTNICLNIISMWFDNKTAAFISSLGIAIGFIGATRDLEVAYEIWIISAGLINVIQMTQPQAAILAWDSEQCLSYYTND